MEVKTKKPARKSEPSALKEIKALQKQVDSLTQLMQGSLHNTVVLYRRMTALAYMVEALSQNKKPRMPKTLRAEIDASLHPEAFQELAKKDEKEFIAKYGQGTLKVLRTLGLQGITRIEELTPLDINKTLQ